MKFVKSVITPCLLISLLACQTNDEPAKAPSNGTLTVNFDGKTRVYTDVYMSEEGKAGSITSWGISASSSETDYLTLGLYGSGATTYPYKQDINNYKLASQIDYKTGGTVFNNYFALVCPDKAEYHSTTGAVKIDEYVAGKHAKGTFSGALLDANSPDECHPISKPFTGEFNITIR